MRVVEITMPMRGLLMSYPRILTNILFVSL
jgi:hypothetical protein